MLSFVTVATVMVSLHSIRNLNYNSNQHGEPSCSSLPIFSFLTLAIETDILQEMIRVADEERPWVKKHWKGRGSDRQAIGKGIWATPKAPWGLGLPCQRTMLRTEGMLRGPLSSGTDVPSLNSHRLLLSQPLALHRLDHLLTPGLHSC